MRNRTFCDQRAEKHSWKTRCGAPRHALTLACRGGGSRGTSHARRSGGVAALSRVDAPLDWTLYRDCHRCSVSVRSRWV